MVGRAREQVSRARLAFKGYFECRVVPGEGVYLLAEHRQTVLRGALVEALAPLLDGTRSRAEIAGDLASRFTERAVDDGLDQLFAACLLTSTEGAADRRQEAFWELAGATRAGNTGPVAVRALGSLDPAHLYSSLKQAGIAVTDGAAALTVVLTDDYLRPELAELNRAATADGTAWLPVKPVGETAWIGPIFQPPDTACWRCLASRLRGLSPVLAHLADDTVGSPPVLGKADTPLTVELALYLAAHRAAGWLAGSCDDPRDVLTVDLIDLSTRRHRLARRPQCPVCGDPDLLTAQSRRPIVFAAPARIGSTDGGYRVRPPEDFLAEHDNLISPVTGIVSNLVDEYPGSDLIHTYSAGNNFALPGGIGRRHGLRSRAGGKGRTSRQARAGALGEAIERYSGVFQGDEPRVRRAFRDFDPADVLHPDALQLFSAKQIADRNEWNARGIAFHRVADPFYEDEPIDWTPVFSITDNRHKYAPTGFLYYGVPRQPGPAVAFPNSNGNAAGTTIEDAALQGFFELVERDSVALWWYNMVARPGIDTTAFDDPYFARWQDFHRASGRQTWLLDLTSDLRIPVVVALARTVDAVEENIMMGFGAHFDQRIAISRAMTELNQFLSPRHDEPIRGQGDPNLARWLRTATLANQPYLAPARSATPTVPVTGGQNLADDLRLAQHTVERLGLELLVHNQTRPDIGVPVVKVIVPGLRHFWPRFAPGRLFDVPVRLGWQSQQLAEDDLNPIGMFL
jgi:ribosomal protein S12 methylthiotransferase accessory factor